MEGQVVRIAELNPQLEMEIGELLGAEDISFTASVDCDLFAMMDSTGRAFCAAGVTGVDKCCILLFVVVRPDERGRGTGSKLVNHVLTHCSGRFDRVYLFTEAEGFFERFGFTETSRDHVPGKICRCAERSDVMTPGAVAMFLDLPKSWDQI